MFKRVPGNQALIEMESPEMAIEAKNALDGQNIYTGCNYLRVQYSALPNLEVTQNSEKSRDYTKEDNILQAEHQPLSPFFSSPLPNFLTSATSNLSYLSSPTSSEGLFFGKLLSPSINPAHHSFQFHESEQTPIDTEYYSQGESLFSYG